MRQMSHLISFNAISNVKKIRNVSLMINFYPKDNLLEITLPFWPVHVPRTKPHH